MPVDQAAAARFQQLLTPKEQRKPEPVVEAVDAEVFDGAMEVEQLREALADLLYAPRDPEWYLRPTSEVLEKLMGWMPQDREQDESYLNPLYFNTAAASAADLLTWLKAAVPAWEQSEVAYAVGEEGGAGAQVSEDYERDPDPVPGTHYYKAQQVGGKLDYLFSDDPQGTDWQTMQVRISQNPYTTPVKDENYGNLLEYRMHRTTYAYQWRSTGTDEWVDNDKAGDLMAQAAAQQPPVAPAKPVWDDQWEMFYKFENGQYLYAHPSRPRDKNSEPVDPWLTHDQALTSTPPTATQAPAQTVPVAPEQPKKQADAGDDEAAPLDEEALDEANSSELEVLINEQIQEFINDDLSDIVRTLTEEIVADESVDTPTPFDAANIVMDILGDLPPSEEDIVEMLARSFS